MRVYKFGGASIANPERVAGLLPLLNDAPKPLVLVISALGKTTNALEAIVNAACKGEQEHAAGLCGELEQIHIDYAKSLLAPEIFEKALADLNLLFAELQWSIEGADAANYDYTYDQVVAMGELFSTRVIAYYFEQQGIDCEWVDVRDIIRTDATYRDARVNWRLSQQLTQKVLQPLLDAGKTVITQGFIGSTEDNATVTLGREGSDYTAALLAAMLQAESVTIWKDVEGLQNADPKLFPNTVKVEAITYHEVIEMAYYGAQVIHPKTIKPLQNANIPLYVKCFLNKDFKGSVIQNEVSSLFYPPLIVLKKDQVLLQVTTRDFSFITEENLSRIYQMFSAMGIKINLIQNAAISFVACIDNNEEKVHRLIDALETDYKVFRNEDVSLLTIRHYSPEILFDLTKSRVILLEQKTRHTVQVVMK